ncbi:hypothetical protein J3B02_002598 [Coemansia erecta]|nr:hypothetical protein J3B02_002598 [Coemansia erecta]
MKRGSCTTLPSSTDGGDGSEITHFVILVPGTGPHREDEKPKGSFLKKAKKFRETLQDTCRREFPDTGATIEMVPIDYHADMQGLETTSRRMAKATLPSIPWIRTMDNEVIGDILYYFSMFHGRRMLEMVIGKLNSAYCAFLEANPGFKGTVNLVAHSLGGIVCYEILYFMNQIDRIGQAMQGNVEMERYRNLPRLKFIPDRLFTMGSPIGGTMVFRNLTMNEFHMGPVGFHNIFHPFDPFGYRTEPLHDDFYADIAAVPVTAARQSDRPMHNSGSNHGWTRHLSLSESMGDLGKNVLDAVALAPVTLMGAVRWAAKSSVALPISTVASKVGNKRRESLDLGRPSKQADDNGSLHLHRRKTFFGLPSTNPHHHHRPNKVDATSSTIARTHFRRRSFSRLLPSFKGFSFGSHTRNNSLVYDGDGNEQIKAAIESMPVASTNKTDDLDGYGEPEDRLSESPQSSSSSALSLMSLAASSRPQTDARPTGTVDDIATDDMFGQLIRIFGPSRPPNRQQQMAESQGLPLSSKLLAARRTAASQVTRGGASLRVTNTVPLDLNGLATCPPEISDAAANQEAPADQTSAVPVCAVNVRTPPDLRIRRANSLPHKNDAALVYLRPDNMLPMLSRRSTTAPAKSPVPMIGRSSSMADTQSAVHQIAAADQSTNVSEEASGREKEMLQQDQQLADDQMEAHPLPYSERMDYIIPFTKRHLQNEYWLGFHAHFSYWTSKEVIFHILHHMICNPASKLSRSNSSFTDIQM